MPSIPPGFARLTAIGYRKDDKGNPVANPDGSYDVNYHFRIAPPQQPPTGPILTVRDDVTEAEIEQLRDALASAPVGPINVADPTKSELPRRPWWQRHASTVYTWGAVVPLTAGTVFLHLHPLPAFIAVSVGLVWSVWSYVRGAK